MMREFPDDRLKLLPKSRIRDIELNKKQTTAETQRFDVAAEDSSEQTSCHRFLHALSVGLLVSFVLCRADVKFNK